MFNNAILGCACLILLIATGGCISNATTPQDNFTLTYSFTPGDRLAYQVTSVSEDKSTNLQENLRIDVINHTDNLYTLRVNPGDTYNEKQNGSSYEISITPLGALVKSGDSGPVFREIQPEFPDGLEYPSRIVFAGESWSRNLAKSGNYSTAEGIVEYSVTGDSRYTLVDQGMVSVTAGRFSCVRIMQDVNFTLKERIGTPDGIMYTTTSGTISGENWIDSKSGILIKSVHQVNKTIYADISNIMRKGGFGEFHREIPSKTTVSCELTDWEKR